MRTRLGTLRVILVTFSTVTEETLGGCVKEHTPDTEQMKEGCSQMATAHRCRTVEGGHVDSSDGGLFRTLGYSTWRDVNHSTALLSSHLPIPDVVQCRAPRCVDARTEATAPFLKCPVRRSFTDFALTLAA